MSDELKPPVFDDEFWRTVEQRAARVRQFVREEIEQAEQVTFSETEAVREPAAAPAGELVPVFTESFWADVHDRAHRVRALAVESLAAAEAELLGDAEAETEVIIPAPARTGVLHRLGRTFNLQRSDAFGLVAALLAAILLIPQLIVPVWSNAGVEPPKILKFVLIGDRDKAGQDEASSGSNAEEGATQAAESRTPGSGGQDSSGRGSGTAPTTGATSSIGTSGSDGSTEGGTAEGSAGAAQEGAAGISAEPSPSPAPSPTSATVVAAPPAAPLDVHAIAVDSTSIRVVWSDASADETGFQVDRQVADGSARSTRRVGRNASSYLWTNLTPETRGCFRVRAVSEGGFSSWSPAAAPGYVCATTPAAPVETPQQPAGQPQAPAPQPTTAPPPPA